MAFSRRPALLPRRRADAPARRSACAAAQQGETFVGHHSEVTATTRSPIGPGRDASRRPARAARRWRERLVAAACAASLGLAALPPVHAQNQLPTLGDPAAADFELGTERKFGERIMREIRADPDFLDDPMLQEYVQSLWQPLLVQARARGNLSSDIDERFAWETFLIRDREVNAFALPGGYVGVYLGMIAVTTTRDELASVLAHEMSHVTQRHIARSVANASQQTLIGMAALLVGVPAASRSGGGDAAQAAVVGGQAVAAQGMLNFSRDMEREADRVGFSVMTGAGFAPEGMASMFERLDQSSRFNDSGGFPYLRSHPLTTERIGEARSRLGATPRTPAAAATGALEHTTAQARARVLMDTRTDALRRWQALDADRVTTAQAERLAGAYESALASTRLRDWARADASIAKALTVVNEGAVRDARAERAVTLLKVESLLARGDAAQATAALKPYAAESSRPVLLLRGQAALAAATPAVLQQSSGELQTWVALHPTDALVWGQLGQVWDKLGQPLRAIRAEAESRYALGDLPGAIDRLRAGQRRVQGGGIDFIDLSVIDSRLRTIEAQRRENAKDEKKER